MNEPVFHKGVCRTVLAASGLLITAQATLGLFPIWICKHREILVNSLCSFYCPERDQNTSFSHPNVVSWNALNTIWMKALSSLQELQCVSIYLNISSAKSPVIWESNFFLKITTFHIFWGDKLTLIKAWLLTHLNLLGPGFFMSWFCILFKHLEEA